jgi:hypothetical protein
MSFRLHIGFTGLCMFVPDPATGQMHVLLPDTEKHAGHVGKHYARLYYDEAHEKPGKPASGDLETVRLDRRALVVPRFGAAAELALPKEIVDITPTAKPLHHSQVLNAPKGVFARVTLGSGSITDCRQGAYWQMDERNVCMSHIVVWTIDVPQDSIQLPLARLNKGREGWMEELFPDDKGDIWLGVYNTVKQDLPTGELPDVQCPDQNPHYADHFGAYYEISTSAPNPVLPKLLACWGECPLDALDPRFRDAGAGALTTRFVSRFGRGADPHRCMVSGGTLG